MRPFDSLASGIISYPLEYIIWPVAILLFFAYPSIYEMSCSSISQILPVWSEAQYVKSASFSVHPSAEPEVLFERVLLQGDDGCNVLSKSFLLDTVEFAQSLAADLPAGSNCRSVFELWNNTKSVLVNDSNVLGTVQSYEASNLLSGTVMSDSVVRSARALWISMSAPREVAEEASEVWQRNLARISSEIKDRPISIVLPPTNTTERTLLSYQICPTIEQWVLSLVPWIHVGYSFLAFNNVKAIRSKPGLLFAFAVELALVISAASTITGVLFKSKELGELPSPLVVSVVCFVSSENMFRLLGAVAGTSAEWSLAARFSKAFDDTYQVTVSSVGLVCVFNFLIGCWCEVAASRQLLFFVSTALVLDLFLHYTFFSSVLAVDVHIIGLDDLLNRSQNSMSSSLKKNGSDEEDNSPRLLWLHLPVFHTAFQTLFAAVMLNWITLVWTERTPDVSPEIASSLVGLCYGESKRGFAYYLSQSAASGKRGGNVLFEVRAPVLAMLHRNGGVALPYESVDFNPSTVRRFDVSYVLEFASFMTFALCAAFLVLKLTVSRSSITNGALMSSYSTGSKPRSSGSVTSGSGSSSSTHLNSFKCKELSKGHFLDIVRISTSSCPFIVSVGMDHKILVWSPLMHPIPPPTQLPVSGRFLPVSNVVMSASGSLIVVFSRCGVVKCWSRLTMSWVWTIHASELERSGPLEAFFRQKHSPGMRSRRSKSPHKKKSVSIAAPDERRGRIYRSRASSSSSFGGGPLQPTRSLSSDLTFDRSNNMKQLSASSHKDFVIVVPSGRLLIIDCTNGVIRKDRAVPEGTEIVACKKLISPRINDRFVSVCRNGDLVVSTAVGSKWRSRIVPVKHNYNDGKVPPSSEAEANNYLGAEIATVPFVGMIVRAYGLTAELIDVESGTLIKEWHIGQFKPGSFKMFHPEPSHCRFCGCASVASFSVAYTELETETLIMHTFSIDNRAKNSICMRVERDPRETRCLGFASVTEHQHWLSSVEGWYPTDLNVVMGVQRKDVATEDKEDLMSRYFEYTAGLRNRKTTADGRIRHKEHSNTSSLLNHTWEGFVMNSNGAVEYYEIPDEGDSGLLINRLGPVGKFGHKSIVVSFGNVMKVLYLGNDDLIEETDGEGSAPTGQQSNSLSFINRRRKMTLKKYRLTHSTNFNDSVPSSAATSDAGF